MPAICIPPVFCRLLWRWKKERIRPYQSTKLLRQHSYYCSSYCSAFRTDYSLLLYSTTLLLTLLLLYYYYTTITPRSNAIPRGELFFRVSPRPFPYSHTPPPIQSYQSYQSDLRVSLSYNTIHTYSCRCPFLHDLKITVFRTFRTHGYF